MREMENKYPNNRRPKAIALVAIILLLIGIIGLSQFCFPTKYSEYDITYLPPGSYTYISISDWHNCHVDGYFSTGSFTGGRGNIACFIFDSAEYEQYCAGGSPSYLYSTDGISGYYSADLPTSSTFYIVFQHSTGEESEHVRLSTAYTITGTYLPGLIAILLALLIGVGVVLFMVALKMRMSMNKSEPMLAEETAYTDFIEDEPKRYS